MRTPLAPSVLVVVALAMGCKRSERAAGNQPVQVCVDRDRDGVDSCSDCDDANPSVRLCGDGGLVVAPPDGGVVLPCGQVDPQSDVNHCGGCNRVCPTPLRAEARCLKGVCGRGPCPPGWFDLDPATFGCEWRCEGTRCTHDDGRRLDLTSPPLPETGPVFQAAASGSSYGGQVQTHPRYTHIGVLGEPTPPTPGVIEQRGAGKHSNQGGLGAAQRR